MKRGRFKSGTEAARNRSLENPFDMSKAKRVRFVNEERDGGPACASSRGRREGTESPRGPELLVGAPKTSEYAYFRKVKNGAVCGRSHSLHKESEKLKNSKISFLNRDASADSGRLKPTTKDLKLSISGERARPSDHDLSVSPHISKDEEPDSKRSKEIRNKIKVRQSFLSENVTPVRQSPSSPSLNKASENSELPNKFKTRTSFLSQNVTPVGQSPFSPTLNTASENSEDQYIGKGIFSAKRHRLRQWVANTSYPGAEKLHPKGFDFVSALLSRLFPKDNKENNDATKRNVDIRKSSTLQHSDNVDRELHLSSKRDHEHLPIICSGRSSAIVPLELDTRCVSGYPSPNYGTESHAQDEFVDPDYRSNNYVWKSSHAQHNLSFYSPFERYRRSGTSHSKELDEYGSITITKDAREELHRLLLDWNSKCGNYIADPSIISHGNARNVRPRLATTWNVDQQQLMDNVHDDKRLCSSSLFSNYLLGFDSFPYHGSDSCLRQDFGPNSDDKKYTMAEPKQFPLALPFTLAEDRHAENILYNSGIIFPYRDQHCLRDSVLDAKPPSDVPWNCLPAADFSAEVAPSIFHTWKFPQNQKSLFSFPHFDEAYGGSFTSFYEAMPNISSSNFFSANEDPASIIHAWQFPQNKNSLYSFSQLEETPRESVTDFYEATDFSAEDLLSFSHAWHFPQNQKSIYSFGRLEEVPGAPFTPLYEGTLNHHTPPSHFETSLDAFISRPLLLDRISPYRPKQKFHFEDDDDN